MCILYYRLREVNLCSDCEMKIVADEYVVFKKTPKGAWITAKGWDRGKKHFVLDGSGKRFAYPDVKDAIHSFKRRKQSQIFHLESQLVQAKAALKGVMAKDFEVGKTFENETLSIFQEVY